MHQIEHYHRYKGVDAKYTTILFKFVLMGNRQAPLKEGGRSVSKMQEVKNTRWSLATAIGAPLPYY
jgi:hypothetical protein